MATPWILVVAAPLAQVAAAVAPLSPTAQLTALGDDATVLRVTLDADTPGALAFALRGVLGDVVDAVGPEGVRAITLLDGVVDLASARAAPGQYVSAPRMASFADAAAMFGGAPPVGGNAVKDMDDLSAQVSGAFAAREAVGPMEHLLRASQGVESWDAALGVGPKPDDDPDDPTSPAEAIAGVVQPGRDRAALRAVLRGQSTEAPAEALPKGEGRRSLEAVLRGEGAGAEGGPTGGLAAPEGDVGES